MPLSSRLFPPTHLILHAKVSGSVTEDARPREHVYPLLLLYFLPSTLFLEKLKVPLFYGYVLFI